MIRNLLTGFLLALVVSTGALACSSNDATSPSGAGGLQSGGALNSGGATAGAGSSAGGAAGSTPMAMGGASTTGGHTGSGGSLAGGATGFGGISGQGGLTGINGGTAGALGQGGIVSSGGAGSGAAPQGGRAGGQGSGGAGASSGGQAGASAGGSASGGRSGGGSAGQAGGDGGQSAEGGSGGFNPCPTNGDPCKILPFGDSITHGYGSADDAGYRSQLFKLVVAANQHVTFSGSLSNGPSDVSGTTFPKNHEGHDGWTVDSGYSTYGYSGISSLIPSPAFNTIPNIVLLMIGTNDITSTSDPGGTADRLDGLIDKIVAAAPDALIVVAQLTPVAWTSSDLNNYNAAIPGIVQDHADSNQHVVLVDMSKMPTSELASDSVHPNDQGYAYMADVWYQAIKDLLQ